MIEPSVALLQNGHLQRSFTSLVQSDNAMLSTVGFEKFPFELMTITKPYTHRTFKKRYLGLSLLTHTHYSEDQEISPGNLTTTSKQHSWLIETQA